MTKDNFSIQAELYARFRPHYPKELYSFIFSHVKDFDAAWDCATGNGQVAQVLSDRFANVYATDISQQQLNNAVQKENIRYSIGSAEESGLVTPVNLITVAQALHWFDFDKFYEEVVRVSTTDTILAYWGYGLIRVNKAIDPLIRHFHDVTVGPYWDPEREIWASEYKSISFPLVNQQKKSFDFHVNWTADHLHGYLSSWSSVQRYIREHNANPVDQLISMLQPYWQKSMPISFPIFLTLGKVK